MDESLPRPRDLEPWIGPRTISLLGREEKVLSPSLVRSLPVAAERGRGSTLKDLDGKEYVDLDAGMGSILFGYSPTHLVEAVIEQSSTLHTCSSSTTSCEAQVRLAELLQALLAPGKQAKVLLETSGAHAVEAALKLARWHTRNSYLIALSGSIHGETYGALSVSSTRPVTRRHFQPFLPGVVFAPYPYCYRCPFHTEHPDCDYACIQFLEDHVLSRELPSENAAGVVFEAVQAGSCVVPPPEYFQKLRRLADAHGLLLIDDESWTAPGRTGSWTALAHWGIRPDILCAGEGLAGGLPLGVVLANPEVMDWDPSSHTSLLGANLLSCAASLKLLETMKEQRLVSEATSKGLHIQRRLKELQSKSALIGDVRGKGLLVGFEVVRDLRGKTPGEAEAQEILRRCWKRGVILGYDGLSTLRISPALTAEMDLLEEAMTTVESVVNQLGEERGLT
ncbi:MAG: aminotransferase class III-fold pyridoxal phosphate-dependent enzyme [Candidatus Bathyarchaeia archaeon]